MSSSPGAARASSPQTRRRESLKVRSVSPSQQQITRSAGITDVARKELPAAELAALGPRPHFGLVLPRVVLVALIDEAIMSPAGYTPHHQSLKRWEGHVYREGHGGRL